MNSQQTRDNGQTPDNSPIALLLIDVINDFAFPEAQQMRSRVVEMARQIAALKRHASGLGIPTIYANDNFGRWRSSVEEQVEHCLQSQGLAKEVVEQLLPGDDDYFVLKPKHSAFFATPLDTLLRHLGSHRLILAGLTSDICVYFTANDAYMLDYELLVPRDCVVAHTEARNDTALEQIATILKADTRPWRQLGLQSDLNP